MEKLQVSNNSDCCGDLKQPIDSDSESTLSESEFLYGFLNPLPKQAGYPNGASD